MQEPDPLEPTDFGLYNERWPLTSGSGRRGRGRGSRGSRGGGRGRGRGGRLPRGISGTSRTGLMGDSSMPGEKSTRKYSRRGRARGRGRRRGRRTVKPRQRSESRPRSIAKENLLGSFAMLSNVKPASVEESPRSSGGEEWGVEPRRAYVEDDENSSGSESDQSEENGQQLDEEYDEPVPAYTRDYHGSRPVGLMDDESEEEEDAEDGEGDEDGEEDDVDRPGDDDVDAEMEEDDELGDDGEEVGEGVENMDEDDGASSYSSEYSD